MRSSPVLFMVVYKAKIDWIAFVFTPGLGISLLCQINLLSLVNDFPLIQLFIQLIWLITLQHFIFTCYWESIGPKDPILSVLAVFHQYGIAIDFTNLVELEAILTQCVSRYTTLFYCSFHFTSTLSALAAIFFLLLLSYT